MKIDTPELNYDLHIHTHLSPCGRDEMIPADILKIASDRGMRIIGITDHLYPSTDMDIFTRTREEITLMRSAMTDAPDVYFGCEVEVMAPGSTAGSPDLTDRFDYLMLGTTHFQNGITILPDFDNDRDIGQYYLRMFEYAVTLEWADTIAHPFFVFPSVCSRDILNYIDDVDLLPALETAKTNNIAMEISQRAIVPGQLEFSNRFYRLCKEVGLKFSIGSDAHSLENVGKVKILEPFIKELGLTLEDLWLPQHKHIISR
ncbi:MAG: PHP domain-containing protein [Armatimonadota bacterium]